MQEDVQQLLLKRRYTDAFELLLDQYQHKVFRLAISMLKDHARAEEVTQDIFLKLWQALPAYDGRAAPFTWLYAIARNTCLSALRSESYRTTLPLEESATGFVQETASKNLEIMQLVHRLPEAQREVIMLFYLEERSIKEAARLLDLPEGTVKNQLHRGRRALAKMMGD
jgi:RNA polymerase sigma-70 factor (ECF subfamily)